jgi:hypothetical protein
LSGPAGLSVSATGRLLWTPTEDDGPSIAPVEVRVSDNGSPVLRATNRFDITVREVNLGPSLNPVAGQRISVGQAWSLDLTASDPDRPLQALSFERVTGPAALLVAANGRITWTPAVPDVGTHPVVVRVRDSGSPILSAETGFSIVVEAAVATPPTFDAPVLEADGRVRIVLRGTPGRRYRVETSTVWGQWQTVSEWDAAPSGLTLLTTPEPGNSTRLYRAVQIP